MGQDEWKVSNGWWFWSAGPAVCTELSLHTQEYRGFSAWRSLEAQAGLSDGTSLETIPTAVWQCRVFLFVGFRKGSCTLSLAFSLSFLSGLVFLICSYFFLLFRNIISQRLMSSARLMLLFMCSGRCRVFQPLHLYSKGSQVRMQNRVSQGKLI